VTGSDAANVCYLRSLRDADKMVGVMRSCYGGNAVVIGGGYIGMECAAALVTNGIKVTMVFPGKHCSKCSRRCYCLSSDKESLNSEFFCVQFSSCLTYCNLYRAVDRLFTPKIAGFYEDYYAAKGVTFIKGARVTSLEAYGNVSTFLLP
jgi:monodehydroascorbate reductase (NADH)